MAVVRTLPAWLVNGCCVLVAEIHFRLQRPRREVVVQNLLPAVSGDRLLAERTARRLYRNFALKLADLWRVESGVPVHNWVTKAEEQEIIRTACARGRGVLVHHAAFGQLGARGLLLADMGIKLTVLTLAGTGGSPDGSPQRLARPLGNRDPDHRPGPVRLCRGHQAASGGGGSGDIH